MLSFLATFVSSWFARVFRVRSWRSLALALVAVLFLGGLAFAAPTFAQQTVGVANDPNSFLNQVRDGTSSIQCGSTGACIISIVTSGFTLILSILMYFLGKIIIILTSVLIVVARYNDFANAMPVTLAWPIIRDIANMFFIVLLLVSAFMTILGIAKDYGLYWETQLPKLIGAAILVNFSKTILMLGIDLSQVVMLAFINAFEGSIAGNFVQAIGLAQYLQFRSQGPAQAGQEAVNMVNIAISYILAIVLAIVAVSVLLMLIGYFVGRIITLWMILIFSPLIFLMSSLPSSIKSSMGEVGQLMGKYTGILVSGPTAAFMLWLTFATVQQAANNPGNMIQGLNIAGQQTGVSGFLTSIGTDQGIANFIVAVAMMMMTLAVAQKAAQSAGPIGAYIGGQAKGLADRGIKWAQRGALAGDAARLAGRGIKRAFPAGGVMKTLDRRYNVSGRVGRGINDAFGGMPIVGGLARQTSIGMQNRRAGLIAEEDKAVSAQLQGIDKLSAREQVAIALNLGTPDARGGFANAMESPEKIRAQHRLLSDEKNRKALLDMRQEEFAGRLRAAGKITDPDEIKRGAAAMAQRSVLDDEMGRLRYLEDQAKNAGDVDEVKRITDQREKNLALMSSDADRQKRIEAIWDDPSKAKNLDASNFKDGQFAFDMMRQAGALRVDAATGNIQSIDSARLREFQDTFKDQKDLLQAAGLVVKQVQEAAPGKTVNRSQFTGAVMQKEANGQSHFFNGNNGAKVLTDFEVDVNSRLKSEFAGRASSAALTTAQEATITDALKAGIPLQVIFTQTNEAKVDPATGAMTADHHVTNHLLNSIVTQLKVGDAHASADFLGDIVEQMQAAKLPASQRAYLMSGLADGDAIANLFDQYKTLVGEERVKITKLIREAVAAEADIKQKQSTGAAMDKFETDLLNFMEDMRKKFPEQAVRNSSGVVTTEAGPRGITTPLFDDRP